MPTPASDDASATQTLLATAVEALGGTRREGQVQMAEAVSAAMADEQHLLVQAGTGTGKSLGYLVPALLHGKRVVVATATLALQHQLVERDIPRLMEAVTGVEVDGKTVDTSFAVLKGRANYACLHRIREGVPDDQGTLVDVPQGSMAETVLALREWAEEEADGGGTGERDNAPRHTDREWRQVSVSSRDCVGASRCAHAAECFAELAREKALRSHLIITNHSLLAIDAIEGVPMIPEYDVVVVDEAHELAARVTQAATMELSAADVERAAKRTTKHVKDEAENAPDDLVDAAEVLRGACAETDPGRFRNTPEEIADALVLVRDAARAVASAIPSGNSGDGDSGDGNAARVQARAGVTEIFEIAGRMAAASEHDVLWLAEGNDRRPPRLHVAPLAVWQTLRNRLLADNTVVLTSATLTLGGDFDAVASGVGLLATERVEPSSVAEVPSVSALRDGRRATSSGTGPEGALRDGAGAPPQGAEAQPWIGLDVGSPFDYRSQAIGYVAAHLPPPGRDGLTDQHLDEIAGLVEAADGRTLGLFSSRRAAEQAAEHVREALPHLTTLAQGEAQLAELSTLFKDDPHTSLFGTLSLWQGLDVPGDTCQLVIIDRIPFPRPDDPLMSARTEAVGRAGGNGFMTVSATHAALLMAQGAGRLIRSSSDRGVVAILDSRVATARYGSFLTSSLPDMWRTTDPQVVRTALKRLAQS